MTIFGRLLAGIEPAARLCRFGRAMKKLGKTMVFQRLNLPGAARIEPATLHCVCALPSLQPLLPTEMNFPPG